MFVTGENLNIHRNYSVKLFVSLLYLTTTIKRAYPSTMVKLNKFKYNYNNYNIHIDILFILSKSLRYSFPSLSMKSAFLDVLKYRKLFNSIQHPMHSCCTTNGW